jgi:quinol monooxygenase YgiN
MSTSRIRRLLGLDIHDSKFSEFDAIAKQMVAVSEKEPRTIAHNFVLSADRRQCPPQEGYADTADLSAHFRGPAVQQFVPELL